MADLSLALFDIDGTIVDSLSMIAQTMQEVFVASGRAAPETAAVQGVIGLSLEVVMQRLDTRVDENEAVVLSEQYRAAFREKVRAGYQESLYDGAADAVRNIGATDWLIGAATGKSRAGLDRVLDNHRLDHLFLTKQTADVALSKPNPEMIFRAMQDTGVEAGNVVMIGDTAYDMQMAKNAGAQAIGVTWGYHSADMLVDAGADMLVDSFDALEDALARRYQG